MKKSLLLALATAVILSSCGTLASLSPSSDGHRFQDGVYGKAPSFRTKTDKATELAESQSLVDKTKGSVIYLFGDKKDTVYVPKEMAARISFSNELGTTVTVTDNDYDWRYDNTWAWYTPYSIGSSWYWSRHYNPWYSSAWAFSPWYYGGFHDPWFYGGFYSPWYYSGFYDPWFYGGYYDPWYYGGFYSPWYYGGFYGPHYYGWYGGWDPFWPGHHHGYHPAPDHHGKEVWRGPRHETGSDRVFASRTTSRGGLGSSASARREVATGTSKSVTRASATGSTTARRTAVRTAPSTRTSSAVRGTSGQSSAAATTGTGTQTSRSNYRRPVATTPAGSGTSNRTGVSSTTRSSVSGSSSTGSTRSSSGFSTGTATRSSSFSTGTATRSSSSYSGGGYSGGSRSSSGGGYSGGGASRSGGSSGARR